MNRIYSPSPSVSASRVPMYMQGFPTEAMLLGQDGSMDPSSADFMPIDTTSSDPESMLIDYGALVPSGADLNLQPSTMYSGETLTIPASVTGPGQLTPGQISSLYTSAVASGSMTAAQAAAAQAQALTAAANAATAVTKAVAPGPAALGPGPAPRVATSLPATTSNPLTQQSIPGVPNWLLFAGAGFAVFMLGRR